MYKLLLDNVGNPVIAAEPVYNERNEISDFRIVYVNQSYVRTSYNFFTAGALYSEYKDRMPKAVDWFGIGVQALSQDTGVEAEYLSPISKNWYHLINKKITASLVLCTLYSITNEKIKDSQLQLLESTDMLSELPNRASFFRVLESWLRDEKGKGAFGVAVVHLNDIETINYASGHEAAAAEIKRCAALLSGFVSDDTRVFRFSDDDFAVLQSGSAVKKDMSVLCEQILHTFSQEQSHCAIGLSLYPSDDTLAVNLIKYADIAMRSALTKNGHGFVFFTQQMYADFLERVQCRSRILSGIAHDKFELYYQPQFNSMTGSLRGFEALLRWHDDEKGFRLPDSFIPAAEENRAIVPLGIWVMNTAAAVLHRWQCAYRFKGILSINVSPVQLKTPGFVQELRDCIRKHGVPPRTIEIEITEGVFISDKEKTSALLDEIRGMGVLVSLDDFGTGYSSLQHLNMMPVTTLKIDKSFVKRLAKTDDLGTSVMRSIVSGVSEHGMETIAEGVESDEQVDILRSLNCTTIQGFLWGKPMPCASCEAFLGGDNGALDHLPSGNMHLLHIEKEDGGGKKSET